MHSPSNSLISVTDSPLYSRSSSQESDAKLANSIFQNVAKLGYLADVSCSHLKNLNSFTIYFLDLRKGKHQPELNCDRVSQSPG